MVDTPQQIVEKLAQLGAEEAKALRILHRIHRLRCKLHRKAYRDHGMKLGLNMAVDPDAIEPKDEDEGEEVQP